MSTPDRIDPKHIRPGSIRHSSLSSELLDQIQTVHQVLGPYIGQNLEQFEIGFMRELHPESEIAIWRCIAIAWHDYHMEYLNGNFLAKDQEKKLIGVLIAISIGESVEHLGVPVEVAVRLAECYEGNEI